MTTTTELSRTTVSTAAHAMSAGDLAELLGAFNDATSKLQSAHESLGAEVARLQRELSQANEQLERSRRLAALGEMAAGIAHEIRNPLGSIRLYARMLESDLAGRAAESALAQRIGAAVRTVDAVVRDVLAFAGDARIRPERVEIDDLFTRAIEESMAAVPVHVEVVRMDRRSTVRELVADASLLHRALVNVISNSLQAMHERGGGEATCTLTTDAGLRDRDGESAGVGPCIWLRVSDTGPGVPASVMDRIFNPFFTTRAAGTGLGLAIVHRIVDAHGGRTTVRNVEADGAIAGASVELLLPETITADRDRTDGNAAAAPKTETLDFQPNSKHRRRSITATVRPTPPPPALRRTPHEHRAGG